MEVKVMFLTDPDKGDPNNEVIGAWAKIDKTGYKGLAYKSEYPNATQNELIQYATANLIKNILEKAI